MDKSKTASYAALTFTKSVPNSGDSMLISIRRPSKPFLSPQFAFRPADRRVGRLGLRAGRREGPEVSDFVRFCPAGINFARSIVIDDETYHPSLGNLRKNSSGPRCRFQAPRAPHGLPRARFFTHSFSHSLTHLLTHSLALFTICL